MLPLLLIDDIVRIETWGWVLNIISLRILTVEGRTKILCSLKELTSILRCQRWVVWIEVHWELIVYLSTQMNDTYELADLIEPSILVVHLHPQLLKLVRGILIFCLLKIG